MQASEVQPALEELVSPFEEEAEPKTKINFSVENPQKDALVDILNRTICQLERQRETN